MIVILTDFKNFDISHLDRVLKFLKETELKDGSVSTYEIKYPKEIIRYSIFHNKKSFTIQTDRFDI